jgi:hypothetical protein
MATDVTAHAACAAATGASAFTCGLIGVSHYLVLAAFCGAGLGVTLTPPLGPLRTVLVFAFTTVGGAMVGPVLAQVAAEWWHLAWLDTTAVQAATTWVLSALLHTLIGALLTLVAPAVRAWAKKAGVQSDADRA